MYPRLGLLVDGEWIDASRREATLVRNPATGEPLGELPIATPDDIDRAAQAAARAFGGWRAMTPLERGRILARVATTLRERAESLSAILTREQGKPLREALAEVIATADTFEWMGEEGRRAYGRIVPSRFAGVEQLVLHEPIGPVAAFSPWNFPAVLAGRKIATALAAGCPIVIKPAEETPGILVEIARICEASGVPPGVLNLLFGRPAEISERLIGHPEIRKLSFTGSTAVGRRLAGLAGAALKRMTLELGGHAPVIVCDDADLDRAASQGVAAKFRNAGQVCNCPTRFYVQRGVFQAFAERFAALARSLRVGDGQRGDVDMGPLIHARRVQAMREFTQDAVRHNGEVLAGGGTPCEQRAVPAAGAFWEPTVIAGAGGGARAMREEPFGPLALLQPFEEIEEAIAAANATDYGLASYAFTASLKSARLLQERIRAGCFSLNTYAITPPELPYGGVKYSGLGREMGSEGLLEHFEVKSVIRAV
ncbi:NAD-dependent succinate-semialdehyde dehydrogenase [Bordetella genomosp. 11]|uniref:NAD-dependent succinate-semialdehyde dehydrogenase n=1 Tax=Bordetella genomosp. 11 TaxID=1416808 RepID=A0A261UFR2_9BORD|nr:NAD-dependent succinate-semialdehyde dehydrogenase [Bordetella genomosp. 11]OZI59723.1 NAD-dependent succinate-semialdehyde dehydrogenase [Bordetella genomosp. 11]